MNGFGWHTQFWGVLRGVQSGASGYPAIAEQPEAQVILVALDMLPWPDLNQKLRHHHQSLILDYLRGHANWLLKREIANYWHKHFLWEMPSPSRNEQIHAQVTMRQTRTPQEIAREFWHSQVRKDFDMPRLSALKGVMTMLESMDIGMLIDFVLHVEHDKLHQYQLYYKNLDLSNGSAIWSNLTAGIVMREHFMRSEFNDLRKELFRVIEAETDDHFMRQIPLPTFR